jgi:WD40 repeat protein
VEDISRDPLTRKVLQNLVQARLLSTGRDELKGVDTVEIIHEALLFEWGLLKKWLDEDREFLTWRDHLREEIERWKGSGKSKDALLSGLPLNQAETWMKNRARELNVEEKDFITRGIQRRERGRRLTITSVAAAMLVITAILIGWVISSTRSADKLEVQVVAAQTAQGAAEAAQSMAEVALSESEKQRQIALSNQLAAQAQLELAGGRPERGVLLALEALETLPYTSQAELALGTAVMESRGRLILSGHTGRVYSAAWSPDEKFIVSAGADGTARIWEVASGKEITALEHPDEVNDVAWSLDGSSILTACEDGIARVWDSESGELLLELSAHRSPVHSAAWSPDGSMIVTASGQVCGNGCAEDTLVRIWSARSGSLLGEFSGHSSTVNDAAWSPDGELIVSVSGDAYTNDRSARIWRVSTMEELVVIKGYLGEVTSADWSPDGGVIVTGQFNGPVRVLDAQTGGELFSLEGHTDIKWSADWSPDGNRIASTSRDRTIRIWDTFNGEEQLQLLGHSDGVNHVEWSPSGNRIVTTSDDGTVRIWDAAPWPELMRLPGMAVASWSPDGKQIAVREEQMWNAYVWEVGNGREQFSLSTRTNALDELDWSPDGSRLATLGWDPGVPAADLSIWDAESGDKLMTMNGHTFFVSALDWSPDGKQIVTTSPDKTAIIWDVESGSQIMTIEHPDEVLGVAWSPNGDRFATTGLDGIGRIWEATTGKELLTFNGAIGQIVWSSDGRSILGAGENDTAIVWNADTGEQILRLEGHTGEINDVAWSPNGDRIVTASRDKTARIWDASTGDLLLILDGNYTIVSTIAWSPDGTRLITSSWDGAIKIWRVWQTTEDLLSYAHACCDIRELDEQERQQFNLP